MAIIARLKAAFGNIDVCLDIVTSILTFAWCTISRTSYNFKNFLPLLLQPLTSILKTLYPLGSKSAKILKNLATIGFENTLSLIVVTSVAAGNV